MSDFVLLKQYLREVLNILFNLKKSAAESYRLLVEAYYDDAPSKITFKQWFRRFNLNVEDKQGKIA